MYKKYDIKEDIRLYKRIKKMGFSSFYYAMKDFVCKIGLYILIQAIK